MFGWFKDRRIQKYLEQTRQYIQAQYVEPKKEEQKPSTDISSGSSKVQYSRRRPPSESTPQFQVWDNDNKPKFSERDRYDNGPKFSLRDNYDSSSVQKTMRSLSSATPTSRVLRDLENSTNMTFVDKLLEHISKRHMRDSDVYRAAQVDRRLFSKIVSDREYKPAKDTFRFCCVWN